MMTVAELSGIDQQIESLIGDVRNLPTPPLVFAQINKIINNPNTSVYDVAEVLSEDAAMSAKVLKLSNSAFYGRTNPVPSVKQAVFVLGLNEVKNIVLAASALNAFKGSAADQEYQENFWRHSLGVAVASRLLVKARKGPGFLEVETAFSAGLLHDIGKMVLACYARAEHQRIRDHQKEHAHTDREAETAILGFDHSHLGAYLARLWNLPLELCQAIASHHHPGETDDAAAYARIVCVADFLTYQAFTDHLLSVDEPETPVQESLARLKINHDDLPELSSLLVEEYAKSKTFLSMALGAEVA